LTTWRFSDGTVANLGGNVEGASLFAQELRRDLLNDPHVSVIPLPSKAEPLDTSDPLMFDLWLTAQANERQPKIKVIERPKDIPELPDLEEDTEGDDPGDEILH